MKDLKLKLIYIRSRCELTTQASMFSSCQSYFFSPELVVVNNTSTTFNSLELVVVKNT